MINNIKISAIMSVYNGDRYLSEAVESVLNQTFTDFEFIIVNDGSTDSSLEIINNYQDERIKVIKNEINIGLTKSLNKAIREAQGEYIARQDADDVSLPNRFDEQIKYLKEHSEVVLLGTSFYIIDNKGEILEKKIASANPRKKLLKGNQFIHGSTMFRKLVIEELGGYNELLTYVQDYELWLRMAKYYEVGNLEKVLYKLRFHDEAIRFKHGGESVLYYLLARKLYRGELDANTERAIEKKGIKSFYFYLNKNEKVTFHKAMAYSKVQDRNIKLAREEYKKVLMLNPLDISNYLDLMLSYLGNTICSMFHNVHKALWHS